MSGPCFRSARGSDGNGHTCFVGDRLHTGDHECCCGYEWPVDDDEWQETKRALGREDDR